MAVSRFLPFKRLRAKTFWPFLDRDLARNPYLRALCFFLPTYVCPWRISLIITDGAWHAKSLNSYINTISTYSPQNLGNAFKWPKTRGFTC